MKKTGIVIALLAGFLLSGCTALDKKQQSGAAVEVAGQYLYRATLDSLTLGLGPEDSLRVVQQYVSQWAKDILMYENANARTNKDIERLVEDYRRTLYVQAYEEYLVQRRMPKSVADSTIVQIYAQMPERFRLDESIVHGILVVIPSNAPKADKLRGWMAKEELDAIEKYAYQNASGYELFLDKWLTTTDLLAQIPVERADLESKLKAQNQIVVTDSLKTYLLQVTQKYLRGDQMPLEYARPQIEKIVLNTRQVDFLNKERERLYNEAIQNKKIIFYE
ncbi:MAG: hypothetical protein IKD12_01950 [Paludibacteraceae bacterium]|nr:hypothetical protein [Paludibacteraceae bacterium]